jgi:hypothetical protein
MESNFYNDDFEELIKQKADQYKLYPSDKVWKRIYSSLHTDRKWFVAGMALLITGILFFAGKELLTTGKTIASNKRPIDFGIAKNQSPEEKDDEQKDNIIPKLPNTPDFAAINSQSGNIQKIRIEDNKLVPADNPIIAGDLVGTNTFLDDNSLIVINDHDLINVTADSARLLGPASPQTITTAATVVPGKINPEIAVRDNSLTIENYPVSSTASEKVSTDPATHPLTPETEAEQTSAQAELKKLNWLQEKALYALPKTAEKSRFQFQEYLSPTASFRTLSGGGNYNIPKSNVQNIPIALTHMGSPNDFVDHRPGKGFELGGSVIYQITRNIAIKTGLQFNYIRYDIDAYSSYAPQPAIITLSSVYGYSPNSITTYTNVQNFGGNATENLQNQYFDLSAPVGIEIKVFGNEKLQFNVAATLEPSYLLNRNSYLLATDYSNYIKDPALFRRWNFDGGLEAFASYRIGKFRVQLGPQFRYQLLSTFVGAYPISENLKEYGLKLGLSKSIW